MEMSQRLAYSPSMQWHGRKGRRGTEMMARSSAKRKKSGGRRRRRPGRRRRFPARCADSFSVEEHHGEAVPMVRFDSSRAARSDGNAVAVVGLGAAMASKN